MIKARVANRSELRTTQKGGQLLKIELVDSYGTAIEGTFFNEPAKRFDTLLKKNKIYVFSNGLVKMANKKFTSVKNDFCIVFEKNSEIHEAVDDGSISNQAFEFSKIAEITDIMPLKVVDTIGIISELGETEEINLKSGQKKARRHIQLVDDSDKSISLTLWGELCDSVSFTVGQVLAVKAAKVSEFGGRSLNCSMDHASLFGL
jgi:replication factor A1